MGFVGTKPTVSSNVVVADAGTIGSASDEDAIAIAADGSVTFTQDIELGHASDTTIARASAGQITVEGTAVLLAGAQTGITTINNVTYNEPTGVATVSCAGTHGFSVGDQITLAGIAFTCPDNTAGITTTIFPDPQKSYIVESIVDVMKYFDTKIKLTCVVGDKTLYSQHLPGEISEYPLVPFHFKWTGTPFPISAVAPLVGKQRELNKAHQLMVHNASLGSSLRWMHEEGSIDTDQWEKYFKKEKVIWSI